MNSKITRRAVLGTVVGGLVAASFLGRALRKSTTIETFPYAKLDDLPIHFDTNLTSEDINKALCVLMDERGKWLTFRGMSGKIQVTAEIVEGEKKLPPPPLVSGFLTLQLVPNSGKGVSDVDLIEFPWEHCLTLRDESEGVERWSFTYNRKTRKSNFKGIKSDDTDAPRVISQILTLPLEVFTNFPNVTLIGAQGLWEITREENSTDAGAYIFRSNKKLTGDNVLMPSFVFKNSHLCEFSGKRKKDIPFPVLCLDNYLTINGFSYPTKQMFTYQENGKPMSRKVKIFINFSDVSIITS
ncbi:hypothetical protein FACS1894170_11900 [Planctomycetales bacterium]|nr:hypothetical protein FACS1894170_11900 [Planctomycetales bacterium]